MTEPKTILTGASVADFIAALADPQRRADCEALCKIMRSITKAEPKMWGDAIVGFGSYHYVYASGREGDWPLIGFSPRKQNLTIYIVAYLERFPDLLAKLGKHSHSKSCLYIKRLADVHKPTLKKLIAASVKHTKAAYPAGKV